MSIHGELDADARDLGHRSHAAMQAHRRAVRSGDVQPWREGMRCPECGEDTVQHHHHGSALAPECWWWACAECDWKTEPE